MTLRPSFSTGLPFLVVIIFPLDPFFPQNSFALSRCGRQPSLDTLGFEYLGVA
jgi:hypothetical protein